MAERSSTANKKLCLQINLTLNIECVNPGWYKWDNGIHGIRIAEMNAFRGASWQHYHLERVIISAPRVLCRPLSLTFMIYYQHGHYFISTTLTGYSLSGL